MSETMGGNLEGWGYYGSPDETQLCSLSYCHLITTTISNTAGGLAQNN